MERATRILDRLMSDVRFDPVAGMLARLGERTNVDPAAPLLRGEPLGHRLHPALTDLPLGFWASALVLDAVGGRGARRAATRLVGLGILTTVPAAVTGMVDQLEVEDRAERRIVAAHALANGSAGLAALLSWTNRHRGRHLRGAAWMTTAMALAAGSGYLGGHLAFGRRSGRDETPPSSVEPVVLDPMAETVRVDETEPIVSVSRE